MTVVIGVGTIFKIANTICTGVCTVLYVCIMVQECSTIQIQYCMYVEWYRNVLQYEYEGLRIRQHYEYEDLRIRRFVFEGNSMETLPVLGFYTCLTCFDYFVAARAA